MYSRPAIYKVRSEVERKAQKAEERRQRPEVRGDNLELRISNSACSLSSATILEDWDIPSAYALTN